jgi:poly(beta-D-mannuronate) lyase
MMMCKASVSAYEEFFQQKEPAMSWSILTQVHLVLSLFSLCILTLIPSVSLFAAQFKVGAASEFKNALGNAKPGDEIVINNGTYQNWDRIEIPSEGTESAPITIRAESPGQVIFTGNNNEFILTGTYIVLKGLKFINRTLNDNQADGIVWFKGAQYSRLTDCIFDNIASERVIAINRQNSGREANYNRIDHCEFRNITSQIVYIWVNGDGKAVGTRIDNNYFKDNQYLSVGDSTIRIGSYREYSDFDTGTIIESNVFINCISDGNLFHHKASGILHRNNYFEKSSNITLRQGNSNIFEQNLFIDIIDKGTGVIRIIGKDHRIVNNVFIGNSNTKKAITLEYGSGDEIEHYETPSGCLIANNTIVAIDQIGISIGEKKYADSNTGIRNKAPYNNMFTNNIISMNKGKLINVIDSPNNQISHNLLHATALANVGTKGDNAILADPKFVAATDLDYQLQANSPAIDEGQTMPSVTVDFAAKPRPNGMAYDIGAFEFQAAILKQPQPPTQLSISILP